MRSNFPRSSFAEVDKLLKLQKIPWRITTNGQFSKNNQICTLVAGKLNMLNDLFGIGFKITNMVIQLCKCYFH